MATKKHSYDYTILGHRLTFSKEEIVYLQAREALVNFAREIKETFISDWRKAFDIVLWDFFLDSGESENLDAVKRICHSLSYSSSSFIHPKGVSLPQQSITDAEQKAESVENAIKTLQLKPPPDSNITEFFKKYESDFASILQSLFEEYKRKCAKKILSILVEEYDCYTITEDAVFQEISIGFEDMIIPLRELLRKDEEIIARIKEDAKDIARTRIANEGVTDTTEYYNVDDYVPGDKYFRKDYELYRKKSLKHWDGIGTCQETDICYRFFYPERREDQYNRYTKRYVYVITQEEYEGEDTFKVHEVHVTAEQNHERLLLIYSYGELPEQLKRLKYINLINDYIKSDSFVEIVYNAFFRAISRAYRPLLTHLPVKYSCVETSNSKQMMAVCENIKSRVIPLAKIPDQCFKILSKNPYCLEAYEFAMLYYGDPTGDLARLANDLNIEGIQKLKESIFHSQIESRINIDTTNDFDGVDAIRREVALRLNMAEDADYAPLTRKRRDHEYSLRLVAGHVFATVDEAKKQRSLYDLFLASDFSTSEITSEKALKKLSQAAKNSGVSIEWLQPLIHQKQVALQERLSAELRKFYETLDVSTEEKALAARLAIKKQAQVIGYKTIENYPPLEALLARYDLKARTVAGQVFENRVEAEGQRAVFDLIRASDFIDSESACLKAIAQSKKIAEKYNIGIAWLLKDLLTAEKCHDEHARVAFDHMYATRAEATSATSNENLFFEAVWARFKCFSEQNSWFMPTCALSKKSLSNINETFGISSSDLFAFVETGMITSGKTGLAITSHGIVVSNGFAMAGVLRENSLVKRFAGRGLSGILDKFKPNQATLSWRDFFTSQPTTVDHGLILNDGMRFDCAKATATALSALFNQLKEWGKSLSCEISTDVHLFPPIENIHTEIVYTPWPDVPKDEEIIVKRESTDFPTKIQSEIYESPHPATTYLGVVAERVCRQYPDESLYLIPDIPPDMALPITTAKWDCSVAATDIQCLTSGKKTKKVVALTSTHLLASATFVKGGVKYYSIPYSAIRSIEEQSSTGWLTISKWDVCSDPRLGACGGFSNVTLAVPCECLRQVVEILKSYLFDTKEGKSVHQSTEQPKRSARRAGGGRARGESRCATISPST